MSKKPSRKQRKETTAKALRSVSAGTPRTPGSAGTPRTSGSAGTPRSTGSTGTPRPGAAASAAAPRSGRDRHARRLAQAARSAAEDSPIPESKPKAKAGSSGDAASKRKRTERAMLFFVGLVAVAGVIAYFAMTRGGPDKQVMVPESPPQPTLKAGTEIAPPSLTGAPAAVEPRKEASPTPTAPPVDSSPPTIVPATAPKAATTATPAKTPPKQAATAAPPIPPKKAPAGEPY